MVTSATPPQTPNRIRKRAKKTLVRLILWAALPAMGLVIMIVGIVTLLLMMAAGGSASQGGSTVPNNSAQVAAPSSISTVCALPGQPGTGIPTKWVPIYEKAARTYGFGSQWEYLAAVNYMESGYSTGTSMSARGNSIGPFQITYYTWSGTSDPYAGKWIAGSWPAQYYQAKNTSAYADSALSQVTQYDLSISRIQKYGGVGISATGGSTASPMNLADAAFSAANLFKKAGVDKSGFTWNTFQHWNASLYEWMGVQSMATSYTSCYNNNWK